MMVRQRFRSGHEHFIHDVCFDHSGTRMATCSADRSIKFWDRSSPDEPWSLAASLSEAHSGPINALSWAHPEFGDVLASCSSDMNVSVFEQVQDRKWLKRASLVESKDEVTDVEFAPKPLGLQLATCSKDGFVRVYEAYDVMKLSMWPLQQEFLVDPTGCLCVSWSKGASFDAPHLVVGTASGAQTWFFNSATRKWEASMILDTSKSAVLDAQWAPSLGRPFRTLALACRDSKLRIARFSAEKGKPFGLVSMVELPDHKAAVWRVSWNLTGSILASSADDGKVFLWKSDLDGKWFRVADLTDSQTTLPSIMESKSTR